MEILGLVDLPAWLMVILAVLLSLYLYTNYKQNYFNRLGIPTKPTVPFLGDFPEVIKKGFHYVDGEMVQKYGKCFGLFLGNYPELMISDPEMIKQITVKEFAKFTDRADLLPLQEKWKSALVMSSGAHWKFLRSTLSPTFSSGKMKHMAPIINSCIDILKRNLKEHVGTCVDVTPYFKGFTMDVICRTGFGLDVNAQAEKEDNLFLKNSQELVNFNPGTNPAFMVALFFPDTIPLLNALGLNMCLMSQKSWDFFIRATKDGFTDRKKADSRYQDLLQIMIDAQKDTPAVSKETDIGKDASMAAYKNRGLMDEEILVNSLIFMAGGFDTTANTLIWLSYCLAVNQDVQDKLVREIDETLGQSPPTYENVFSLKYLDMVINETLRMYPVSARINRKPSEDMEICGRLLPKGLDCTIPVFGIHYLPEYWPNPDKFDPERFSPENESKIVPYTFLPFGTGPRNCLGMRLALLELKMTVVGLLQTYRLSPAPDLKIPPKIANIGMLKPKDPMSLKFTLREATDYSETEQK